MTAATYSIRDLADAFDVSLRTLRFYEGRGLIAPQRRGNRRIYSSADRERLQRILQLARFDFSLSEIARLLLLDPASQTMQSALLTRLRELDDDIAARTKARNELRDILARKNLAEVA
ncbi:MAG TPA: MerR family transcriptional regulator [Roseovarius sp.]|nr:MerR family transcriptional regulator [Roseovarius sp.]